MKKTADINISATSRIYNKLVTKKNATYKNNEWACLENQEVKPIQPVQINIHQSDTYRKDLSWLQWAMGSREITSEVIILKQSRYIIVSTA